MISFFYPHLPESSGAEAHRRGLLEGFRQNGVKCISRNQFSRLDSIRFLLDAILGRVLYIRMNANAGNVRAVLKVLHWFRRRYVLEVNAPLQEDQSDAGYYEKTVRNAKLIVCVSSTLKSYLSKYNENVVVVSNGGQLPTDEENAGTSPTSHFLFIYNARWHWQSAAHIEHVARVLQSLKMNLKVVDVANDIKSGDLPPNVELVPALSREAYGRALHEAAGFYLEYLPSQDSELGFYGDSLKFRDYWNTNKPILIQGPLMEWAPSPQSPEFGVFQLSDCESFKGSHWEGCTFDRKPYGWHNACERMLHRMKAH